MNASPQIRVLTVDDHPLLREGICGTVNAQPDMTVVAEASDGLQAISAFRSYRPDVTLMDLRMPGMSGLEAMETIRSEFPTARIIVLTTFTGDVLAVRAIKVGAASYLLKNMLRTELIDTIRRVHAGHRRIPPEVAGEMAEHMGEDILSEREIEVLKHVAAGSSNKIIASNLFLSEHTVKGHLKNILAKLNASDRTHAVTIALRRGFLDM